MPLCVPDDELRTNAIKRLQYFVVVDFQIGGTEVHKYEAIRKWKRRDM